MRFGFEDARLLLSFGDEDFRLLLPFCDQYLFAPFAFGTHLLFHRFADRFRRHDVFHFDAVYFDAPRIGRFVEYRTHLRVDDVAARKRRIQIELSDDVAQRRCT